VLLARPGAWTIVIREAIAMSVRDPDRYEPMDEQLEDRAVVRRLPGGRHRRGRAAPEAPVVGSSVVEAEPLFTFETLSVVDDDALVDLTEPVPPAPVPSRVEPSRFEPAPPPASIVGASEAGVRPGMFKSFRTWWRQESLARAAQKRAFATAEAIIRAQAVQRSAQPFEPSPTPETHTQAVRGVMALTEERFQSLGLRSDRLQDELVGISRSMRELHDLMMLGVPGGTTEAAASVLGTLEERFEALLSALSEEFRSRSEETDRRLAEQLTVQSAELATLLESAVERIRAAIPEGFLAVRAAIPKELAEVRAAIPQEIQRIRAVIPEEMERLRAQQRRELDQIMELSQKQAELVRATSRRELEKIREAIPQGFDELRAMLPEEFGRVRDAIPVEIDKVRAMLPEEIERVREANAADFERIRAQIPEELEKVRLTIPMEIERLRAAIPEAIERLRSSEDELERVASSLRERFRAETSEQLDRVRWAIPAKVHEVISEISGFTSADSVEGERAEPR
jgi:hypothetical protein